MYKTTTSGTTYDGGHHHYGGQNGGLLYSQSASALESPAIEIIEDKLYWISGTVPPTVSENQNAYYFSVDNVSSQTWKY